MHVRGVAESEEALVQVCRCTMSYKAVTLYLTELNTTKTCNWMPCKWVHWSSVAKFNLVFSHVDQPLIEYWSHKYERAYHFTSSTIVDSFIPPSRKFSPALCSWSTMSSTERVKTGVAYLFAPPQAIPFPKAASNNWPGICREGNACGFITISGTIPWIVKGKFSRDPRKSRTPFCPYACLRAYLQDMEIELATAIVEQKNDRKCVLRM